MTLMEQGKYGRTRVCQIPPISKREKLASATMGSHLNDIYTYVDIEGGTVVGVIVSIDVFRRR